MKKYEDISRIFDEVLHKSCLLKRIKGKLLWLSLDVFLYAFGVKNNDSHRNLPSPKEAASNFAFETASIPEDVSGIFYLQA